MSLYPAFLDARLGGSVSPRESYDLAAGEGARETMATAGIAMFATNPVFGVGFGMFQFISPSYISGKATDTTYSHDQYLSVLAEQGIVGVLIVGSLIAITTVAVVRSTSPLRDTAIAMGATYLTVSLFLHTATVFQSSSLIWLVLAATLAGRPRGTMPRRPA